MMSPCHCVTAAFADGQSTSTIDGTNQLGETLLTHTAEESNIAHTHGPAEFREYTHTRSKIGIHPPTHHIHGQTHVHTHIIQISIRTPAHIHAHTHTRTHTHTLSLSLSLFLGAHEGCAADAILTSRHTAMNGVSTAAASAGGLAGAMAGGTSTMGGSDAASNALATKPQGVRANLVQRADEFSVLCAAVVPLLEEYQRQNACAPSSPPHASLLHLHPPAPHLPCLSVSLFARRAVTSSHHSAASPPQPLVRPVLQPSARLQPPPPK